MEKRPAAVDQRGADGDFTRFLHYVMIVLLFVVTYATLNPIQ